MKDSKDIKSYDVVKKFYYLPDDNRYAKKEGGFYYWIDEGKVEFHQNYIDIDFGDIYAIEISEEDFNEALEKSRKKVKEYKWWLIY